MAKVLVTGGAGFIGSHIAAALVHHGAHITSQPRDGLNEQLADLSIALPAPWGAFVERAALAPATD